MTEIDLATLVNQEPDYEYGNKSPIQVIRIAPHANGSLDPFESLENPGGTGSEFPYDLDSYIGKLEEIRENLQIIGDPESTETDPKQFEITIVNGHLLMDDRPALLQMSTSGSSIIDNPSNAVELAQLALAVPDMPIVYVASPGNGESSDLTKDEYRQAAKDGRLISKENGSKDFMNYRAFPTLQALARALKDAGINISHLSANASGAHFSSALALELDDVKRAFLYNTTNISDRSFLGLAGASLWEISSQRRYKEASHDPLRLTDERREEAARILGRSAGKKLVQAKSNTFGPLKMIRQNQMLRRGNEHGYAAALQAVSAMLKHPEARLTYVFPEFAAQYKSIEDLERFVGIVESLGSTAIQQEDIDSLRVPMGQYGHSHYPSVWQTLQGYAFNR